MSMIRSHLHSSPPVFLLSLFFLLLLSSSLVTTSSSISPADCEDRMATLGGVRDSNHGSENSAEIDCLARFAVDEHNKKQNAMLEFARVVKAKEQVVAGTMHHLTIEAVDAGKKTLYEAKVWVKPWLNFKELQEFNHAGDAPGTAGPTFTTADLGAKRDGHAPGLQEVAVHDPAVQDAADHAVNTIQQRSNSLFPYELQEIVQAQAEDDMVDDGLLVVDDSAKFHMILKIKRGSNEEKFKVEVHKNNEGTYHLNQVKPHA